MNQFIYNFTEAVHNSLKQYFIFYEIMKSFDRVLVLIITNSNLKERILFKFVLIEVSGTEYWSLKS